MEKLNCPIWGTPADVVMLPNDSWSVDSPRAGGKYTITGTRFVTAANLSDDQKILVTSWLVSQHSLGETVPHISDNLDIDSIRRPSVLQRADYLLEYINSQLSDISDIFTYPRRLQNIDRPLWERTAEMLAWSASTEMENLHYLLAFLEDQGLITTPPPRFQSEHLMRILTVAGHAHLAELGNRAIDSKQAFVAMWFDEETDEAYHKGIKSGIEKSGYTPVRIDEKEHLSKIDDEIIAEIRRSKFLVVDLTEGDAVTRRDGSTQGGTRGSVYYEAGFAHGLDIPVIYTCHKDSRKKVHFDVRQYACIVWKTPEELKSKLAQRISARFGDGPVSYIKAENGETGEAIQGEAGLI